LCIIIVYNNWETCSKNIALNIIRYFQFKEWDMNLKNNELNKDFKGDKYVILVSLFETRRIRDARVNSKPQLRNGANCAFCNEGAGSGWRVRSRAGFPGNRVFPGLRHGFPLTRFTLASEVVDDATATFTD